MNVRHARSQFVSEPVKWVSAMTLAAFILAGCNIGSSGTGTLSLDVTDAPIDSAVEVNVVFNGVVIIGGEGGRTEILYDDPKTINLLELQNGLTESLLDEHPLPAGEYEQIRLLVDVDQEQGSSNIVLDDGTHFLTIPSGPQTGLKLVSGFTVPVNDSIALTIDFDLRKAIVLTGGSNPTYKLKPALRLLDNSEVGRIEGTVSSTTVTSLGSSCDTGAAVYVYEGADVTPGDIGGDGAEPVITTLVDTEEPGETSYDFTFAFLTAGEYTVAFTCDAELDDTEAADADDLTFEGTQNTTVTVDGIATVEF